MSEICIFAIISPSNCRRCVLNSKQCCSTGMRTSNFLSDTFAFYRTKTQNWCFARFEMSNPAGSLDIRMYCVFNRRFDQRKIWVMYTLWRNSCHVLIQEPSRFQISFFCDNQLHNEAHLHENTKCFFPLSLFTGWWKEDWNIRLKIWSESIISGYEGYC